MADGKISDDPIAIDLVDAFVPIVQDAQNKKAPATLFSGSFNGTEVIKTAAATLGISDVGKTFILDKATADTLSFDAAVALGSTWMVMVKNIGAGTWSLDPNGAETIDGTASISLSTGESCVVSCNGTALRTLFKASASAIVNHRLFGGL